MFAHALTYGRNLRHQHVCWWKSFGLYVSSTCQEVSSGSFTVNKRNVLTYFILITLDLKRNKKQAYLKQSERAT